jgi:hypothetical protein
MNATTKSPKVLAAEFRAIADKIESLKGRKALIGAKLCERDPSGKTLAVYLNNGGRGNYDFSRSLIRHARMFHVDQGHDKLKDRAVQFSRVGSYAAKLSRDLDARVTHDKVPEAVLFGDAVSVEIECFLPRASTCCLDRSWNGDFCDSCGSTATQEEIARSSSAKLIRRIRNAKLSSCVTVKGDGSLRPDPGYDPVEIVVSFTRSNRAPLFAVCKILKDMRATVNTSCGLHVHLDMRHLTARGAMTRARRIAAAVSYLKRILPPSRRTNSYCTDDLSSIRNGNRYSFVNGRAYQKHKTIEVRGHSGTTDAVKIDHWINLMIALADKRGPTPSIRTYEELAAHLARSLKPELASWIRERESRFNRVMEERAVRESAAMDELDPESDDAPRFDHPDDIAADNDPTDCYGASLPIFQAAE